MRKPLIISFILLFINPASFAASDCTGGVAATDNVSQLTNFSVVELRRYPVAPGQLRVFTQYFESWFPEAFEQLGSIAFGEFSERDNPNTFTWIRGFHTIQDRAVAEAAFYYGPVWQEHRDLLNSLLPGVDDNVLLLHPLNPNTTIPVLPAVNPATEPQGAQGIVVAEIYAVKKEDLDDFTKRAMDAIAHYNVAGVRPAGVLVTLDVPNNFPQLPYRTDGPYLVVLDIVKDEGVLKTTFNPLVRSASQALAATGLLRQPPEIIVMDPGPRSRLRWLPKCD